MPLLTGGAGGILGGGQITYLIRDDMTNDAAAPLPASEAAYPGPGTAINNDTGNQMSRSGGRLRQSANPISAFTDPRRSYDALARVAGRTLAFKITQASPAIMVAWENNALGGPGTMQMGFYWSAAGIFQIYYLGGIAQVTVGPLTANTDYWVALTLESTGGYCHILGGSENPDWTLVWVFDAGTGTPLKPSISFSNNASRSVDSLRVADLLGPFNPDTMQILNLTGATQVVGSELVSNGNMETGSPPTGWNTGAATLSSDADERTGGAGSKSLGITGNNGAYGGQDLTLVLNAMYFAKGWVKNITSTGIGIWMNSGGSNVFAAPYSPSTSWVTAGALIRATATSNNVRVYIQGAVQLGRGDDVSVVRVTPGATQTAEASGTFRYAYTLPVSPISGEAVVLHFRVNAPGEEFINGLAFWVFRNAANNNWDFKLVSYAAGVETPISTGTGIGDTGEISVYCNGQTIRVTTRGAGTSQWTQRITGATSALYTDKPYINYTHTPAFTHVALKAWKLNNATASVALNRMII